MIFLIILLVNMDRTATSLEMVVYGKFDGLHKSHRVKGKRWVSVVNAT